MTPQERFVAAARAAIGTPFRHQGRSLARGLDCAGLLIHAAREAGYAPVDVEAYARRPSGGLLESAIGQQDFLVQVYDRKPGDILLMRFSGDPQHLSIFAGETIIHAWAMSRKICEHRFTPEWRARTVATFRLEGAQ
jgi:cell wall-associated NlpC family hydrolase